MKLCILNSKGLRRCRGNRLNHKSRMNDPKSNQTSESSVESARSFDLLGRRLDNVIQPIRKDIDRAEKLFCDGDTVTAVNMFHRCERKLNLIQSVLGMRQFKTLPDRPAAPVKTPWYRRLFGTSLLIVALLGTGCSTVTKYRSIKELQRVEEAKQKLAANETARLEKGRDFAYGTAKALDKICTPSPEVKVAKVLNDRAMLTLGTPDSQTALRLQQMVDDLLSLNEDLRKRGAADLAARDAAIAKLELKSKNLEHSVENAEDARDDKFVTNANKASQWDEENSFINSINPFHDLWKFVKKMFVLLLIVGVVGVLLKVLAMFFPALKPLSALVDVVLGGFGKAIFRLAPTAKAAAGVVAAETHAAATQALTKTVAALQDLRYDNTPEIKQLIDTTLEKHHDDITRTEVRRIKEVNGL